MTLKLSLYLLPKFSRVPFTIVLISGVSTMVNDTLLNFDRRYKYELKVIFDQWQKLHLGLDALRYLTPPIAEILCDINPRAIVVCGFLMKSL